MSNLGAAYSKRAEMADGAERVRVLRRAVDADRAVLEATGQLDDHTRMLAATNLGASLLRWAECVAGEERLSLLAASVAASRQAGSTDRRTRYPSSWARVQSNLAAALAHWAETCGGAEQALIAAESVLTCHEALQLRPRESVPALWALTTNNLAFALRVQADGTSDPPERARLVADSVSACRQALQVADRTGQPDIWADLQNNLGSALVRQAEMQNGPDRARLAGEAAAAYRSSLEVFTETAAPLEYRRVLSDLQRREALLT
jgi:hypothetical protein